MQRYIVPMANPKAQILFNILTISTLAQFKALQEGCSTTLFCIPQKSGRKAPMRLAEGILVTHKYLIINLLYMF